MGFVCSVCGEYHADRLLDIRLSLPDPIFALDEEERRRRTWLSEDFCVLDELRFFVRGLLEIPVPDLDADFGYGVWLEVEETLFTHLLEHWRSPDQFEPFPATLANELGPYVGTIGLVAEARPVSVDRLPTVVLADADHPLVREQRRGVSVERSDELAAAVRHT